MRRHSPPVGDERLACSLPAGQHRRLHSPATHRPDRQRSARRHPASRALRVAARWPPATLDPGHRRARGLGIGSAALAWPGTNVGTNGLSNDPNNHNQQRCSSGVKRSARGSEPARRGLRGLWVRVPRGPQTCRSAPRPMSLCRASGAQAATQRLRSRTSVTSAHREQARLRVVVRTREQGVEGGGRGGVDRAATEVHILGRGDARAPELVGDDAVLRYVCGTTHSKCPALPDLAEGLLDVVPVPVAAQDVGAVNIRPMLRSSSGSLGRSTASWRRRVTGHVGAGPERARPRGRRRQCRSRARRSRVDPPPGASPRRTVAPATPRLRRIRRAHRLTRRATRQRHLLHRARLPICHPAQDRSHADTQLGRLIDRFAGEHPPSFSRRHPFPRSHASHGDPPTSRRQEPPIGGTTPRKDSRRLDPSVTSAGPFGAVSGRLVPLPSEPSETAQLLGWRTLRRV